MGKGVLNNIELRIQANDELYKSRERSVYEKNLYSLIGGVNENYLGKKVTFYFLIF